MAGVPSGAGTDLDRQREVRKLSHLRYDNSVLSQFSENLSRDAGRRDRPAEARPARHGAQRGEQVAGDPVDALRGPTEIVFL
jgi:hypothetical protein